jgi:hypothetical protein
VDSYPKLLGRTAHVKIVQLKTCSPLVGDFHFSHTAAITIWALSAMAIAWAFLAFLLHQAFSLLKTISNNRESLVSSVAWVTSGD